MELEDLLVKVNNQPINTPCEIQLSVSRRGARTFLGYYAGFVSPVSKKAHLKYIYYWESKEDNDINREDKNILHPNPENIPISDIVDIKFLKYKD